MTIDDELRDTWRSMDARLGRIELDVADGAARKRASRARFWLVIFGLGQLVQLLLGLVIVVVFAAFWLEHRAVPHAFVYGIVMHLYGLLLAMTAGRDLHAIMHVNPEGPVLETQERFAEIRRRRERSGWALALGGCVMWVPLTLAGFYAMGADLWVARPGFVLHALGWAAVAVIITIVLLRRWPESGLTASLRRAEAALVSTREFGRG